MLKFTIIIFFTLFFIGCGNSSSTVIDDKKTPCLDNINDLNLTKVRKNTLDYSIQVHHCRELYSDSTFNSYYIDDDKSLIVGTLLGNEY